MGKNGSYLGGKPRRIRFPSFSMAGKVKLINVKIFLPSHIRLFSSNRQIQNIHLVGKGIIFSSGWDQNKRLNTTLIRKP